jgi:hypothetical protein
MSAQKAQVEAPDVGPCAIRFFAPHAQRTDRAGLPSRPIYRSLAAEGQRIIIAREVSVMTAAPGLQEGQDCRCVSVRPGIRLLAAEIFEADDLKQDKGVDGYACENVRVRAVTTAVLGLQSPNDSS